MDQKQKILLVEDDAFIRDLFHGELERAGFAVESFEKGEEGFAALQKHPFDLFLLDIMLPDTNGLEILKRVKTDPHLNSTKVVLLTNLGQDGIIKEGFDLGAAGYLVKSAYNPDQVINEVKNFLSPQTPATPA